MKWSTSCVNQIDVLFTHKVPGTAVRASAACLFFAKRNDTHLLQRQSLSCQECWDKQLSCIELGCSHAGCLSSHDKLSAYASPVLHLICNFCVLFVLKSLGSSTWGKSLSGEKPLHAWLVCAVKENFAKHCCLKLNCGNTNESTKQSSRWQPKMPFCTPKRLCPLRNEVSNFFLFEKVKRALILIFKNLCVGQSS